MENKLIIKMNNYRYPLNYITNDSICIEIGVWQGKFSNEILKKNPKKLYMIDPWLFQKPEKVGTKWYSGIIAKNQKDMDNIYLDNIQKYACNYKINFLKGKSDNILPLLDEEYFDWIYIDGNHEEEFVYNDLVNSLRIIKNGGYITGDDVLWKNDNGIHTVKKSLENFVNKYNLPCKVNDDQFVIKINK